MAATTPSSSEKRKSIEGIQDQRALENGRAAKKQKLPVRGKGAASGSHESMSLEIPMSSLSRRGGVLEEVGDSQDEDDGVSDEEEEDFKTPMERKHIVFDEDDYEEFVTPLEKPAKFGLDSSAAPLAGSGSEGNENEDEEDDEDDDDDAPPEAVSSRQAAVQSMEIAQDAAKAADEQDAAKKRKRQERDVLFKTQAEARKRTSGPAAQAEASTSTDLALRPETQRKKKLEIPHVLPLELLESDDDEETRPAERAEGRGPKKIKFDTAEMSSLEERLPRDRRVGSTVYRVLADRDDGILAPKAHKQAMNVRQGLLLRKRAPRRRGGFFIKS